jgi:hypothetical protein
MGMPQVIVKAAPALNKAFEVNANTTVRDVLLEVLVWLKKPEADAVKVALFVNSEQLLDEALVLARVADEAILTLGPRKVNQAQEPDPVAGPALQAQLTAYITDPPAKTFVLISIASFVNSDQDEDELRKQQLPPDVVKFCTDKKLALAVILADPAFAYGQAKQIYDSGAGWKLQDMEKGRRVQRYEFSGEPGLDCTLWAYATKVEWNSDEPMTTVAGVELANLGAKLEEVGGSLRVRLFNGDIIYPPPSPAVSKES